MLYIPLEHKSSFLAIGFVEVSTVGVAVPLSNPKSVSPVRLAHGWLQAVASLLGFVGAAKLPGVVLPLLGQTVLIWQVLLASAVLKKRLGAAQVRACSALWWQPRWVQVPNAAMFLAYTFVAQTICDKPRCFVLQFLGVGLVLAGVCLAALPADPSGSPLAGIHPVFPALYVFSMLLPVSCVACVHTLLLWCADSESAPPASHRTATACAARSLPLPAPFHCRRLTRCSRSRCSEQHGRSWAPTWTFLSSTL